MNDTFMRLQPGDGSPSGMQPSNLVQPEAFTTEDHTELDQLYFATGDEGITLRAPRAVYSPIDFPVLRLQR